jgi:hypothetical protein
MSLIELLSSHVAAWKQVYLNQRFSTMLQTEPYRATEQRGDRSI